MYLLMGAVNHSLFGTGTLRTVLCNIKVTFQIEIKNKYGGRPRIMSALNGCLSSLVLPYYCYMVIVITCWFW